MAGARRRPRGREPIDVSTDTHIGNPDLRKGLSEARPPSDPGVGEPFDWLPRLGRAQVRLERLLARWMPEGRLPEAIEWLEKATGAEVRVERAEVVWRASGLGRPGLIVQLTAPGLGTRLAVGIEVPLAHHWVDQLLGFDRPFAQSRLQITPVEWGIWSFLALRVLDSLDAGAGKELQSPGISGLIGPGDLTLDRVGPDAFNPTDLGAIVTIRWLVRVGSLSGAVRLWVPESVVQLWLTSHVEAAAEERQRVEPARTVEPRGANDPGIPRGELAGTWRAEAGFVSMPQGLRRLRAGAVLPLSETRLTGSPRNPAGPVDLIIDLDEQDISFKIPTRPVADTGGHLVRVESGMTRERRTRDPIDKTNLSRTAMSQPTASQGTTAGGSGVAPLDVPVTLTVELGRVNLTVGQLAGLKPGDVVELGRHSRAPVELTSNGRLVARGELVQIDTDLGIRVTNTFL
jgi:flagellar motor switch protein FliN